MRASFAERFHHVVVGALLVAVAFLQAPGRIVADTKIDLVLAPAEFLRRATDLWEPLGAFGQVQNQAYGYLFPMGPFFTLGWLAEVPEWVIQRAWWSVIFVVAYSGLVCLARLLGIGSHWPIVLGGVAYALSPRMLAIVGTSSIEVWPMAMAPWVLVPLVLAARGRTPWAMAAASALTVACVGGVNAVATFAVIPPAALWILFMRPGQTRRRLMLWWPVFVLLGTLWWIGPLLLLGRYSPPFLDFIESSSLTSFSATILDTMRGTSNWTIYLSTPSSAGGALVTQSLMLLNLTVLIAVGVHGLSRRATPHRRFLVTCLALGLVLVTLGHTASHGGWAAPELQALLDGALSPLRNTHKFDVLVRLPLVLGMVAAVDRYARAANTAVRGSAAAWPQRGVVFLAVVGVLGSAGPAWSGQLPPRGSFDSVPAYWYEAADWLTEQDDGATLLLQASSFANYTWGRINDEPLQALTSTPWAVRNAIPLTNPGTIRMMDVISSRLRDNDTSGLRDLLAANGIRYLVVRNDLNSGLDDMRVELAHATLSELPDVPRVAHFGPRLEREPYRDVDGRRTFFDAGWQEDRWALEVYEVSDAARASVTPSDEVPVVVGGVESLPGLFDTGVLTGDSAVLAADHDPEMTPSRWILTDGARRQEAAFGRVHSNRSASMTADEPYRSRRRVNDYVSAADADWTAHRDLHGARRITASSSQAWVDGPGVIDQGSQPWSAFDRDPATAWRASGNDVGKPSWIEIEFDEPRRIEHVHVVLEGQVLESRELTVRSENEVRSVSASGSLASTIAVDDETNFVRISSPSTAESLLAIRDIVVDGAPLSRPLVLPPAPGRWSVPDAVVLQADTGYRGGCVTFDEVLRCQPGGDGWGEDGRTIDREIDLPRSTTLPLRLDVAPIGGAPLDELLQDGNLFSVSASSHVTGSGLASATNVLDGESGTAWVASSRDPRPTLRASWVSEREIDRVQIDLDERVAASRPDRVTLRFSDGSSVLSDVGASGAVRFSQREASWVQIEFEKQQSIANITATGGIETLPVGVSELRVGGVDRSGPLSNEKQRFACGTGPEVVVNGTATATRLIGSKSQLRSGEGLRARPCGDADVELRAGTNRILVIGSAVARPVRVVLGENGPVPTGRSTAVSVSPDSLAVDLNVVRKPSVLRVAQNANPVWRSDMSEMTLTVNGWQQGWTLPAGTPGTVEATVDAGPVYRGALAVGAALAAMLLVLTLIGLRRAKDRRDRSVQPPRVSRVRTTATVVVGVLAAGMLGGWGGLLAAGLGALAVAVSGRHGAVVPALVVGLVGVFSAGWPWGSANGWFGTFAWPQYLMLVGFGALVGTFVRLPKFRSRSAGSSMT